MNDIRAEVQRLWGVYKAAHEEVLKAADRKEEAAETLVDMYKFRGMKGDEGQTLDLYVKELAQAYDEYEDLLVKMDRAANAHTKKYKEMRDG